MRDPSRIKIFCERLAAVWQRFPDWRFGQLVENVFQDLQKDPFFIEDKEMIKFFEMYVKSWEVIPNNDLETEWR